MKIELKFCSQWNYAPQAASLASKIFGEFGTKVSSLNLIPDGGGCFELSLDGELTYSKLQTGEFPDEGKMLEEIAKRF